MTNNYHEIERILTKFKNGATYSDSIEQIQMLFPSLDELAGGDRGDV